MTWPTRKRDHGPRTVSWWTDTVPSTKIALSAHTYVGIHFQFDTPGHIWSFRYCEEPNDVDAHWLLFWDTASPGILAARLFHVAPVLGADGWVQLWVHPLLPVVAARDYFA